MKYMGSKNRIAKHILPIMLSYAEAANIKTWVEPFVGGANMIDKVPASFDRIGYDLNAHVIAALIDIRDRPEELPDEVSEDFYNIIKGLPAASVTSWARFVCSFGGKFEKGYARESGSDERTFCGYGKRSALKQSPFLQGASLEVASYESLKDIKGAIIYCDPPYQGTSGYKTGAFNHLAFWDWVR